MWKLRFRVQRVGVDRSAAYTFARDVYWGSRLSLPYKIRYYKYGIRNKKYSKQRQSESWPESLRVCGLRFKDYLFIFIFIYFCYGYKSLDDMCKYYI